MLERDMSYIGYNFLSSLDTVKEIKQEVPFLSRCIDIVLVNSADEVISIEFKVSKWRHAIEQAKNHKLGSDKAYICLPKRIITKSLSDALKEEGIGLMLFDPESANKITIAIDAEYGGNVSAFKKILLESLSKV